MLIHCSIYVEPINTFNCKHSLLRLCLKKKKKLKLCVFCENEILIHYRCSLDRHFYTIVYNNCLAKPSSFRLKKKEKEKFISLKISYFSLSLFINLPILNSLNFQRFYIVIALSSSSISLSHSLSRSFIQFLVYLRIILSLRRRLAGSPVL